MKMILFVSGNKFKFALLILLFFFAKRNVIYGQTGPAPQTITFPAISTKNSCDADFATNATSTNPTIPLTYSSSNAAVAIISSTGIIHITGGGTSTISVSQTGTALFATATPKSQTLTVTQTLKPNISISYVDNSYTCPNNPVTFTAVASNMNDNFSYQWQLNGITVGTNSPKNTYYSLKSSDVIQCIAVNGGTCPVTTGSNVVTGIVVSAFNYVPTAVSITSSASGSICSGTAVTFTAKPTNGGTSPSYQWQINGSNVGTDNTVFTSSTLNDGDVVKCLLTNSINACAIAINASSNSIKVTVNGSANPAPTISVSPTSFEACSGTSITFTANTTNAGSTPTYQWQVNGKNVGANQLTYSSSTLNNGDQITCNLNTNLTCTAITTASSNAATVQIDQLVNNAVSIIASAPNGIISANEQVTFTATTSSVTSGTTVVSYQWRVNGANAGTDSPVFTDSNLKNDDIVDCVVNTTGKCIAISETYSNQIKIIIRTPVVVVNTFTPNGDGINDTWNIPSLASYPGCAVNIFTRYGSTIYSSIGYSKAWDGTFNNKLLPPGVYYYIIDLKDGNKPVGGSITLLR